GMAKREVLPLLRPARIGHSARKHLKAVVPDVALEERVTGIENLIEAHCGRLRVIGEVTHDPIVVRTRRIREGNGVELRGREFREAALRNLVARKWQPRERIENRQG